MRLVRPFFRVKRLRVAEPDSKNGNEHHCAEEDLLAQPHDFKRSPVAKEGVSQHFMPQTDYSTNHPCGSTTSVSLTPLGVNGMPPSPVF